MVVECFFDILILFLQKFLRKSTRGFQFSSFDHSSVRPPPLECPKEIVFAIDTILDFLKTCQRDEAAFLVGGRACMNFRMRYLLEIGKKSVNRFVSNKMMAQKCEVDG